MSNFKDVSLVEKKNNFQNTQKYFLSFFFRLRHNAINANDSGTDIYIIIEQ